MGPHPKADQWTTIEELTRKRNTEARVAEIKGSEPEPEDDPPEPTASGMGVSAGAVYPNLLKAAREVGIEKVLAIYRDTVGKLCTPEQDVAFEAKLRADVGTDAAKGATHAKDAKAQPSSPKRSKWLQRWINVLLPIAERDGLGAAMAYYDDAGFDSQSYSQDYWKHHDGRLRVNAALRDLLSPPPPPETPEEIAERAIVKRLLSSIEWPQWGDAPVTREAPSSVPSEEALRAHLAAVEARRAEHWAYPLPR